MVEEALVRERFHEYSEAESVDCDLSKPSFRALVRDLLRDLGEVRARERFLGFLWFLMS